MKTFDHQPDIDNPNLLILTAGAAIDAGNCHLGKAGQACYGTEDGIVGRFEAMASRAGDKLATAQGRA